MSSTISCRQCEAENPKDAIQCHICGANFQSKGKTIAQLPQGQIKTDNATFVPEELISSKISNWRRDYTPFQENENELSLKWSPTPTLFEVGVLLVILSLVGPAMIFLLPTLLADFLSKNSLPTIWRLPLMFILIAILAFVLGKFLAPRIKDIRYGRDLYFSRSTQTVSLNGKPLYLFHEIASVDIREKMRRREKATEYYYHLFLQKKDGDSFYITKSQDDYYIGEFGRYLATFLAVELIQHKHQAFAGLRELASQFRFRGRKTTAAKPRHRTAFRVPGQQQVRLQLLEKTNSLWIKGVLDNSLYAQLIRTLGFKKDDFPPQLWTFKALKSEDSQEILAEKSLFTFFQELDGSMLVLGNSGVGKTTALLKLADDLAHAARQDNRLQIPVYLSLSSWDVKYHSLDNWLIDELHQNYQVSRMFAYTWLPEEPFVLLLDGFDELVEDNQRTCISAINRFLSDYPMTKIVVSSCPENHETMIGPWAISGTVMISPFTTEQVDKCFATVIEKTSILSQDLPTNQTLNKLARTPLFLTLITLTYQAKKPLPLATNDLIEGNNQVISDFLHHSLTKRPVKGRYSPERCLHWLGYLAHQLQTQSQSLYHVEFMQPDWLDNEKKTRWYRLITSSYYVLSGVLLALYAQTLINYSQFAYYARIFSFLQGSFIESISSALFIGIFVTVFTIFSTYIVPFLKNYKSLGREEKEIVFNRPRAFRWPGLRLFIKEVLDGNQFETSQASDSAFLSRIFKAFYREQPIMNDMVPNQPIWREIKKSYHLPSAITKTLFFAGAFAWWVHFLGFNWLYEALLWFVFLLPIFPLAPLTPGSSIVKHFILRFVLWITNCLPGYNLIPFLDEMAERNILHKVGGAYQFVHPTIQNHLATQYTGKDRS